MQWTRPSVEDVVLWTMLLALCGLALRGFLKDIKRREEVSRAIDEKFQRSAKAADYAQQYRAARAALKVLILRELTLVRHQQKQSLGAEALNAVIALRAQAGDHPDILREWDPVLEEVYSEKVDPEKAHQLLDEVLYPETLEDERELTRRVSAGLEDSIKSGVAEQSAVDAAISLRRIHDRNTRKQREEAEGEATERRYQEELDQKFRDHMDAETRKSMGNIARMYGLSSNAFDHLTLPDALARIQTIRELHVATGEDIAKCALLYANEIRPQELIDRANANRSNGR
jgi:hypothetical protein